MPRKRDRAEFASDNGPPITSELRRSKGWSIKPTLTGLRARLHTGLESYLDEQTRTAAKVRGNARERVDAEVLDIVSLLGMITVMSEECLEAYRPDDDDETGLEIKVARIRQNLRDPAHQIIAYNWNQSSVLQEDLGPEGGPAPARSEETCQAQRTVREWYGQQCILTGNTICVEAAHILADCALRVPRRATNFWAALEGFWPESHVKELRLIVNSPNGQKLNILVLDRNSHFLWGRAAFALRPIEPEPLSSTLRLEFFMLNKDPSSKRILNHGQGRHVFNDNRRSRGRTPPGRPVMSGDQIILKTSDREQFPLPSAPLIQLQYDLNRALCACGQAEILRLLFRDDDKEDPTSLDPLSLPESPSPANANLVQYLTYRAVQEGIIGEGDREKWVRRYMGHGGDGPELGETGVGTMAFGPGCGS